MISYITVCNSVCFFFKLINYGFIFLRPDSNKFYLNTMIFLSETNGVNKISNRRLCYISISEAMVLFIV